MTSRCKRPVLPAFDLKVVQESVPDDHHAIQNAAACQEMSDVLPDLALGSWRDATDGTLLKVRGVTHVLNVAKELPSPRELKAMESGEFACKTIPLMDCHSQDIAIHFQEAFEFIELARKQGGKVLVHCRRGISRSPAIVVGYLMRHDGRSFQEAVDFVKSKRTCISLNLAFQEMLAEYEPGKSLNGLDETSTRTESMGVDEFGLSAPESEKSTQPAKDQNWGDE